MASSIIAGAAESLRAAPGKQSFHSDLWLENDVARDRYRVVSPLVSYSHRRGETEYAKEVGANRRTRHL